MDVMLGWVLVVLIIGCVVVYGVRAEPRVIDPKNHDGGDLFNARIASEFPLASGV